MIPLESAIAIVMAVASERESPDRMPAEAVALPDSLHRILREDLLADADSPRFDKSIRDGFAVRSEDVASAPVVLAVIGESRAGEAAGVELGPGSCCEIMTGAPLPGGATAVVMVEHSERLSPSSVKILRRVEAGSGLLRRGSEVRQGDRVLLSGRKIRAGDIGTLATAGKSTVLVSRKPRVAILATGDELVDVDENPAHGQIRNSNSFSLHAQVRAAGAEPVLLGIGRDRPDALRDKIGEGLESDILLVSGGVSMGKYDFVEDVFAQLGVRVLFDAVAIRPGKPAVFGHRDDTFVFGLPGNPVSTMVTFHMFVRPLIARLLKAAEPAEALRAELRSPARRDPVRTAIVPAAVRFETDRYRAETASWQGSSDVAGVSRANALIVIPQGSGEMQAGEWAEFFYLE